MARQETKLPKNKWIEKHAPLNSKDSYGEELANAITHGIGAVASMAGLILLVLRAATRGSTTSVVGASVFGVSMVILYSASFLYHSFKDPQKRRVCRIIDHCSIYLLIAGTYTPVTLLIGGGWGWSLFGIVWGIGVVGIFLELFELKRSKLVTIAVYVAMGWTVVIALGPLTRVVDPRMINWGLAGGVTYTAGTIFYAMKRMPYHHSIWHLFVLAGSTFFWIGIYRYVI